MMNSSRHNLLALSIAVLSAPTFAQTTPDAGALQQQIDRERQQPLPQRVAPAKPAPAAMKPVTGAVVTVKQFRFVGNTLQSSEQLAA